MPDIVPNGLSRGRANPGPCLGLVFAVVLSVFLSGAAASEEAGEQSIAMPLRVVNLNPFHLLYGVPSSHGTPVLPSGESELIASMDLASHLRAGNSGAEQVLIDGETYRQSLSLRQGFGDGWEYLLDLSFVSHSAGSFDSFIEEWHRAFGLPQGDRLISPRDQLALIYASDGTVHVNIDSSVSSFGDVSVGVGYALPSSPFSNDGVALRAVAKLPTGNEDELAGSGGMSVSVWAETSGALFESPASREWLYSATLGVLVDEAPRSLPGIGDRFIVFGRFGVTWLLLTDFNFTTQIDAHSSHFGGSSLAPLSDPVVMIGLGGSWRFSESATLEVAVIEDDGSFHAAPDTGLHIALRWRL